MRSSFRNAFLAATSALVATVSAQGDTQPKVALSVGPQAVAAGAKFNAVLTVTFSAGLHGYQNPPTDPTLIPVTLKLADSTFKLISVKYPKGVPTIVGGEPKPVNVYEGTIKIPVVLKAPTKVGKTILSLSFGYQQCNASACFPPGTILSKATVNVVKSVPPAAAHASRTAV